MQTNQPFDRIRKISHAEIDLQQWDEVISKAQNRRVYAFSWYLDISSEGWDALVWGNYEFVMPLTLRKKWGITYLIQPCESQQLGIFPTPPADVLKRFWEEIFRLYKYAAISLNSENFPNISLAEIEIKPRQNFLLNLNQSYQNTFSHFSPYSRRHLRRALKNELTISENISIHDYIEFKKLNQPAEIYGNCLPMFRQIIEYTVAQKKAVLMGVCDRDKALCAAALFIFDTNRIYYLGGVSSKQGKTLSAMFLLLNHVILKFAGQNIFLDFEGSMVPGIAEFFKGFGAQPETYYYAKFNRLPKPIRLIKK